jgi:hypothetical protein
VCSPSCRLIQRAANGQAAAVENTFASLNAGGGVDHRRLDVLVAQQLLDGAHVIVVLQEVCGEAVAQAVGADRFDDARPLRRLADRFLQPAFVQVVAADGAAAGVDR